jgi:hypothetical protein
LIRSSAAPAKTAPSPTPFSRRRLFFALSSSTLTLSAIVSSVLLKWIVCEVPNDRRVAFSRAQEQWRAIATLDGFRGQLGGWSMREVDEVCILGFWRDQSALDRFMQHEHDPIVQHSKQAETYASIRVSIFDTDEVVAPPLANAVEICLAGRMVEFFDQEKLLMRVAIRTGSLGADTIMIEPAWTIEPRG